MDYQDFLGVEDAWFWFCGVIIMRNEAGGLKKQAEVLVPRVCDYHQMHKLIKEMRLKGLLTNKHLRVMSDWGQRFCSPLYEKRAKYSEKMIWQDAMFLLEKNMIEKGYLNEI